MLVTFKTKAYANITMFGEVGTRMLEMMDFGVALPGAIRPEDVPAALENLEKALAKLPRQVESDGDDDDGQARVGLHTRAVPLIELLRAAIADEEYVRWE